MPNVLVSFHSHTGRTLRIAEMLAEILGADMAPIVEVAPRGRGFLPDIRTTWQALTRQATAIRPGTKDLAAYDLILLGTQVWAGNVPPPVRSFVLRERERIGRYALFCSYGGGGAKRVLDEIGEMIGRPPLGRLMILQRDQKSESFRPRIAEFAAQVAGAGRTDSDLHSASSSS